MKGNLRTALAAAAAASILAGCTGDTSVSRQPSQNEINAGIERRIAEVDKMGISPEQKERMKQQIRGSAPSLAETREEGLKGNK